MPENEAPLPVTPNAKEHIEALRSMPPKPGEIYARMAACMADIGAVPKNGKAPAVVGGYAFRSIDDMYFAGQAAMVKHGVFCAPRLVRETVERVTTRDGKASMHVVIVVDHVFFAPDGSSVTVTTLGEALDMSDKAANKAMSAAFKYALMQVFCVPVEGGAMDTEKDNIELGGQPPAAKPAAAKPAPAKPATRQDLAALDALIKDMSNRAALQAAWCKHFNVATMNDLSAQAVAAITAKVKAKLAEAPREPGEEG
jgi:hypothetical protein